MSGVSLPVTRPVGGALLVGAASCRAKPLATLGGLGYTCAESDDPYAAMAELCRRPLLYRAVILSISSMYREELQLIRAVKRRFPHVEVWLADTDGRQGTLADGMRLGADGLLADDGLHRIAVGPMEQTDCDAAEVPLSASFLAAGDSDEVAPADLSSGQSPHRHEIDNTLSEPVLSADELRALLQEQPASPPNGENAE